MDFFDILKLSLRNISFNRRYYAGFAAVISASICGGVTAASAARAGILLANGAGSGLDLALRAVVILFAAICFLSVLLHITVDLKLRESEINAYLTYGMTRRQVTALFAAENLTVAFAAAGIGCVLSHALTGFIGLESYTEAADVYIYIAAVAAAYIAKLLFYKKFAMQ